MWSWGPTTGARLPFEQRLLYKWSMAHEDLLAFGSVARAPDVDTMLFEADRKARRHPLFGRAEELLAQRSVVIFGAGRFGRRLLRALRDRPSPPTIEGFCDNAQALWGSTIEGLRVLSPHELDANKEGRVALIAAMAQAGLAAQLRAMGLSYLHADQQGAIGYHPAPSLPLRREALVRVEQHLADELSRRTYLNVLKGRIFQEFSFGLSGNLFFHEIVRGPQYFDRELFSYGEGELLVDCGPYDGDALIEFAMTMECAGVRRYDAVAFEADAANHQRVRATLEAYGLQRFRSRHVAVAEAEGEVDADDQNNCRTDGLAPVCTSTDSLDRLLDGEPVTLLKLDIEGFELPALRGAKGLISRCRPKLAVCIYHSAEELVDIPLYLMDTHPDYRWFVRHHSATSPWETVCYGVPV